LAGGCLSTAERLKQKSLHLPKTAPFSKMINLAVLFYRKNLYLKAKVDIESKFSEGDKLIISRIKYINLRESVGIIDLELFQNCTFVDLSCTGNTVSDVISIY
jgi:hypothetical protein